MNADQYKSENYVRAESKSAERQPHPPPSLLSPLFGPARGEARRASSLEAAPATGRVPEEGFDALGAGRPRPPGRRCAAPWWRRPAGAAVPYDSAPRRARGCRQPPRPPSRPRAAARVRRVPAARKGAEAPGTSHRRTGRPRGTTFPGCLPPLPPCSTTLASPRI